MNSNNLSLRVQTFSRMIRGNYIYVDKTDLVHKLVSAKRFYFLSRPRRFGKSLLLSTIKAYFKGEKELFKGLKMEALEKEWKKYPVLSFDLNGCIYQDYEGVSDYLSGFIEEYEEEYNLTNVVRGINQVSKDFVMRFKRLIRTVFHQCGCQIVILIDEYDKPILETLDDPILQKRHIDHLKSFYSVLKTMEDYIRFVMIAGVTRLGYSSIFSDMDNLHDITLDPEYTAICGFTQEELDQKFSCCISELGANEGWSYEQTIDELRGYYLGYRFSEKDVKVYNPYTLLNCFRNKNLSNDWFCTGDSSFLVRILQEHGLKLDQLEGFEATSAMLKDIDVNFSEPISLLYQSGYLTIVGFEPQDKQRIYVLDFPNEEVRFSFYQRVRRYHESSP